MLLRAYRLAIILYVFLPVTPLWAQGDIPPPVPVPSVEIETLSLPEYNPEMQEKTLKKPQEKRRITRNLKKPAPAPAPAPAPTPAATPAPIPTPAAAKAMLPKEMLTGKSGINVLELFSTQACTFCPKADEMMSQFINRDDTIALSCHVDYFDVKQGSRALPLCSTRQSAYEVSLEKGSKYTPQIVVNGQYDAVGYRMSDIIVALKKGAIAPVPRAKITSVGEGLHTVHLPALSTNGTHKVWLMVYDNPQNVTVQDGGNKGKNITYYNLVSNAGFLGEWDGQGKKITFNAKMTETSKGFAVIVQNTTSNQITVAGKYTK